MKASFTILLRNMAIDILEIIPVTIISQVRFFESRGRGYGFPVPAGLRHLLQSGLGARRRAVFDRQGRLPQGGFQPRPAVRLPASGRRAMDQRLGR